MITPYHGRLSPFRLRSNAILFHDWRYVDHGEPRWATEEGNVLGLWSSKPVPALKWVGRRIPRGIGLRVVSAAKSDAVVRPDRPWEAVIFGASLVFDQGKYRMWYETVPPEHISQGIAGDYNLLCYAESGDGISWEKPSLGMVKYRGSSDNNIVYGGPVTPHGYHGGSVFLDPAGKEGERYKLVHLGILSEEDYLSLKNRGDVRFDPLSERQEKHRAVFGALSGDGLSWKTLEEPLMLQSSDTQNIGCYDELLGKYVLYVRTWVLGRRSIGRSESDRFGGFPLPETIIWPGPDVGPSDLWYSNGKTTVPGSPDYHLMFPKRWRVSEDRFYVHLSTSPDGIMWSFPPGGEVLAPGEPGSWDAGGVDVGCGMVEMPGGRVAVPFTGYRVPHKHTRSEPLGEIGLASWDEDRLVALHCEEEGEFSTLPVLFEGEELYVNARTATTGGIAIGVMGQRGDVLDGRGLRRCDPLCGDLKGQLVTWDGESRIEHGPEEALSFRVKMAQADLFSLRFS